MLVKREVSASEILISALERINEFHLNSYITLLEREAFKVADRVDRKIAGGEDISPLAGIPIAIKDNICTQGTPTTCGSKILSGFTAPYDATAVSNLVAQDGVILGKTNLDEFGMGSSNENSSFGPVSNPWDTSRVPGGSSGGSAAAVASGQTVLALGTDTGGSVRLPACFCGVVGLKPTYGRVSRYGLVAFASSLDQIGTITRTVEDCSLLLEAISGYDARDSTSLPDPVPKYSESLKRGTEGVTIGIGEECFGSGLDDEVERTVREAAHRLADLGARLVDISLPMTQHVIPTYYLIASAEASSNLARYDGVRYGYRSKKGGGLLRMYESTRKEGLGDEVKRRIMLGTYALSAGYYEAYYLRAEKVRTRIREDFDRVFKEVDLVLTPTSPTVAFKKGEKIKDPLQMYLSDVFTVSVNLAGIPAMSLPCGFSSQGLPIALQLIGKPLDEETILRVAYAYQSATRWQESKVPALETEF